MLTTALRADPFLGLAFLSLRSRLISSPPQPDLMTQAEIIGYNARGPFEFRTSRCNRYLLPHGKEDIVHRGVIQVPT